MDIDPGLYVANLSTLYRSLPLTERAAAAARDGFTQVESWWDFPSATPPQGAVDSFLTAVEAAGVQLLAINSHGGNRERGERGLASLPDRQQEFRDSIASVLAVAQRTGATRFNVAFGSLDSHIEPEEQFRNGAESLSWAAGQLQTVGGILLLEPLARGENGDYPFFNGYDVVRYIRTYLAEASNVRLLFDTYHLASAGLDLVEAWGDLEPYVGHVQLADFPGRGRPGSGILPFDALLDAISASGYAGPLSLEYLA